MPDVTARRKRPKFLTLYQIRLPLPAIVSILHRLSGAALFVCLPLLLLLFDRSLGSPEDFAAFRELAGHPLSKLVLFGLLWAYLHHFCAGIRFLLLDMDIGVSLGPARKSAAAVLVVSLALSAVIGVALW